MCDIAIMCYTENCKHAALVYSYLHLVTVATRSSFEIILWYYNYIVVHNVIKLLKFSVMVLRMQLAYIVTAT